MFLSILFTVTRFCFLSICVYCVNFFVLFPIQLSKIFSVFLFLIIFILLDIGVFCSTICLFSSIYLLYLDRPISSISVFSWLNFAVNTLQNVFIVFFSIFLLFSLFIYTSISFAKSETRILSCILGILNFFSSNFLIILANGSIVISYKRQNIKYSCLTSLSIFITFGNFLFIETRSLCHELLKEI